MAKNVFVAKSADVLGKVKVGDEVNIWFQAVLRGDSNVISIGNRSNVQDGTIVHVDDTFLTTVGEDVTIGHNCIIHGCEIKDNALIGMGSTIMNGAVIGKNSLVGANSLVTEGVVIPENSLVMGSPAKVVRELTAEEIEELSQNAHWYVENAKQFEGKEYEIDESGYLKVSE